ncbi:MAG: hypothetical protein ACI9K8_001415, partial [Reinekea sp.]
MSLNLIAKKYYSNSTDHLVSFWYGTCNKLTNIQIE